jgi:hypothetical protein
MAPRTVQQAFGLKDPEVNALATLAGLEGYRGAQGQDVAAVAANVLARRLSGNWGGRDIRNIAKSPGQYEAVFPYSMEQLGDPNFGAKVLGGPGEFEKIKGIVNDLSQVGTQFRQSKGAQSFRGTAAYKSKKPTDYLPVPGKSNFYFDPLSETLYQKGEKLFASPGGQLNQTAAQSPGSSDNRSVEQILGQALGLIKKPELEKTKSLTETIKEQVVKSVLPTLINPMGMFGGF